MKIAFLVTRLEKPSARYRVLQYIPFLEKNRFMPEVFKIPRNHFERLKLFRKMINFDLVFLQKKLFGSFEWNLLRRSSKKIIYDFDDAVMFRDPMKKSQISLRRKKIFAKTVKGADIVIAGNKYLKKLASVESPKVFVIPTSIDMIRYKEKQSDFLSDKIILGWIGSSSTLFYLKKMKGILDDVFDKFPHTRLKIVGDDFFDCDRMPVIKKLWKYEEEIDDLHTFDIGLMPLSDDIWSQGKCGLKLLQYMAVGIPAVCSPVGVNQKIVNDGINGYLAHGEGEWIEKVSTLIRDRQLRHTMGRKGRKTVFQFYSVEVNSKKLIKLLRSH